MHIVSRLDLNMASVDLINIYNRTCVLCPFCSRSPRKNVVHFSPENETEAVIMKSLGEERQIWPGCGHMTVQNLDLVLCVDVDSSLWRCAGGKSSVLSSNGGILKMDKVHHQSDFTINIWLDNYNNWTGVSYLLNSSGVCLEVSHMASSMVKYTLLHTV